MRTDTNTCAMIRSWMEKWLPWAAGGYGGSELCVARARYRATQRERLQRVVSPTFLFDGCCPRFDVAIGALIPTFFLLRHSIGHALAELNSAYWTRVVVVGVRRWVVGGGGQDGCL